MMVAVVTSKTRWESSFASPAFLVKLVVAYYSMRKKLLPDVKVQKGSLHNLFSRQVPHYSLIFLYFLICNRLYLANCSLEWHKYVCFNEKGPPTAIIIQDIYSPKPPKEKNSTPPPTHPQQTYKLLRVFVKICHWEGGRIIHVEHQIVDDWYK